MSVVLVTLAVSDSIPPLRVLSDHVLERGCLDTLDGSEREANLRLAALQQPETGGVWRKDDHSPCCTSDAPPASGDIQALGLHTALVHIPQSRTGVRELALLAVVSAPARRNVSCEEPRLVKMLPGVGEVSDTAICNGGVQNVVLFTQMPPDVRGLLWGLESAEELRVDWFLPPLAHASPVVVAVGLDVHHVLAILDTESCSRAHRRWDVADSVWYFVWFKRTLVLQLYRAGREDG